MKKPDIVKMKLSFSLLLFLSVLFDDAYLLWRVLFLYRIFEAYWQITLLNTLRTTPSVNENRDFLWRFWIYCISLIKNDFIQNQNKVLGDRLLIFKWYFQWKYQKDEALDFSILRRTILPEKNESFLISWQRWVRQSYVSWKCQRQNSHKWTSTNTHISIFSSIHFDIATNIDFLPSSDIDIHTTTTLIPSSQVTTAP